VRKKKRSVPEKLKFAVHASQLWTAATFGMTSNHLVSVAEESRSSETGEAPSQNPQRRRHF